LSPSLPFGVLGAYYRFTKKWASNSGPMALMSTACRQKLTSRNSSAGIIQFPGFPGSRGSATWPAAYTNKCRISNPKGHPCCSQGPDIVLCLYEKMLNFKSTGVSLLLSWPVFVMICIYPIAYCPLPNRTLSTQLPVGSLVCPLGYISMSFSSTRVMHSHNNCV
jgi:hypothetical protein